ncbi:MAG: FemAB family PEP-CTERM system-associated protein [Candidatus Zixiibacteriota bacterium]|nr:MAG: FemAB family PEP-CTERM system-associated protein [candidate division Zixibacteria bacterium]
MTDVVEYTADYKAAWSTFVEKADNATIAHDIGWMEVIAKGLGHTPRYLLAVDGQQVTGILPLFEVKTWWRSRYLVSLPWIDYGGVCAADAATEQLLVARGREITEQARAEFMELRSVNPTAVDLPTSQKKVTFLLQLDRDPEKVWTGFNAKLRNQIRKADKSGLTTELGGLEFLGAFYKVFARNMRDLGTPVWGRDFFAEILTTFKDSARIILVRMSGRVIAGGLVLSFKDRLYVPSASAYREYLKYCPNHALYWRVIKDGCEGGYRFFDFGRSTWESNTFKFKKQWAPEPTQLSWQYHLNKTQEIPMVNPSNPRYRLFIGLWRKLPLAIANAVGPKLIKNFP